MTDQFDAKVRRSEKSWTYFYTILGFALVLEATIIGMMTPIAFPWNILLFIVIAVATGWLFIESGWLQNRLIAIKNRYENKLR